MEGTSSITAYPYSLFNIIYIIRIYGQFDGELQMALIVGLGPLKRIPGHSPRRLIS